MKKLETLKKSKLAKEIEEAFPDAELIDFEESN